MLCVYECVSAHVCATTGHLHYPQLALFHKCAVTCVHHLTSSSDEVVKVTLQKSLIAWEALISYTHTHTVGVCVCSGYFSHTHTQAVRRLVTCRKGNEERIKTSLSVQMAKKKKKKRSGGVEVIEWDKMLPFIVFLWEHWD